MKNLESAFEAACASLELQHKNIPQNGNWHALQPLEGSRNGSGRAKIFSDGRGGIVYNWRTGEQLAFFASDSHRPSREDRAEQKQQAAQASQQAAIARGQVHQQVAERAEKLLAQTKPCSAYAYLARKGLTPCSELRTLGASLVAPMRDVAGKLWSLQFVATDGVKRFLTGGRKQGCFTWIGAPKPGNVQRAAMQTTARTARMCPDGEKIVLCEGVATAISLHQISGFSTACAFDAGNLESVASAIRELYPRCVLYIGADHDTVGVAKAKSAAFKFGAKVCVAPLAGEDWNDCHQRLGESKARALWLEVTHES